MSLKEKKKKKPLKAKPLKVKSFDKIPNLIRNGQS